MKYVIVTTLRIEGMEACLCDISILTCFFKSGRNRQNNEAASEEPPTRTEF